MSAVRYATIDGRPFNPPIDGTSGLENEACCAFVTNTRLVLTVHISKKMSSQKRRQHSYGDGKLVCTDHSTPQAFRRHLCKVRHVCHCRYRHSYSHGKAADEHNAWQSTVAWPVAREVRCGIQLLCASDKDGTQRRLQPLVFNWYCYV